MTASFDVFISYNHHDRVLVDELIDRLKGRFIRAWVDDGELPPGTAGFQRKIEAALLDAPAAIIAIGPAGMGRWQEFEVDLSLEQSMRRSIRVIPILLPGSALGLLPARIAARFVIVDFSEGLDNPKRLDGLERGITGHALASIPVNLSPAPVADSLDLSDHLDTFAMAEIKARVYKAAEATASLAAALIADVDDGPGNDLTRWVSLLSACDGSAVTWRPSSVSFVFGEQSKRPRSTAASTAACTPPQPIESARRGRPFLVRPSACVG